MTFSHSKLFPSLALALALSTPIAQAATVRVTCLNDSGDSARINNAITASAAGDEIVIDGPALLTATIRLLGDRTIRGESRNGTVLKQANGANLSALLASASYLDNSTSAGNPLTISHLTIDGNRANNTAATAGIVLRNSQAKVDDVSVSSSGGDAILISNPSANGTALSTNMSYGVIQNCFITSSSGCGIRANDAGNKCVGWDVIENWISGSGANSNAIHIGNGNAWEVDCNHLYGVPRHAIYVDHAYAASISDNYIEGFGETTTTGSYSGIFVTLNGGSTTTLEGNRIYNFGGEDSASSTYSYLRVDRVNYGSATAVVQGNLIGGASTTSASTGLEYHSGSGTTLTVSYKGNTVSNVGTPRFAGAGVTLSSANSGN